jgi:hypothetical protein
LVAVRGERPVGGRAKDFDAHPHQMTECQNTLQERAADVLGAAGSPASHVELKALQTKTGQMGVIVLFVQFLSVIARRAPSSKDFLCCNISSKHAFTKPLINKRF